MNSLSIFALCLSFCSGHQQYGVEKRLGAGAFGTVYLVRLTTVLERGKGATTAGDEMNATVVSPELAATVGRSRTGIARIVKLQTPDYPLEFYHMREMRRRLSAAFSNGKSQMDVVSFTVCKSCCQRRFLVDKHCNLHLRIHSKSAGQKISRNIDFWLLPWTLVYFCRKLFIDLFDEASFEI